MPDRRRYYLNALFDLELGGYSVDAVRRSAAEMTTLFLPFVGAGDEIVLDVDVPDDHRTYLRTFISAAPDAGTLPGPGTPEDGSTADFVWGWNRQAADRLGSVDTSSLPPFDAVRRVNSRRLCSVIGSREGFGVPMSHFCDTAESFEAAADALDGSFPLVIKPAFGGAGFGLRVVPGTDSLSTERRLVDSYLQRGGLVLEPWCERCTDLSASVDVNPGGSWGLVTLQRQFVNRYGSFYGMYCAPVDPLVVPWGSTLESAALRFASEAAQCGYFGPLGIDSFVYRDRNGKERLATGIEVNARFTMGMLAQKLRRRIAPHSHTLFRFIGKKRCHLPDTTAAWCAQIGSNFVFSRETGCGIIPITPMRIGYRGCWSQPQRSAFFIVGTSLEQIERFDLQLRNRFLPE